MSEGLLIFLGMVFIAVFLLSQGIVIPVFGEGGKVRKRLKERIEEIEANSEEESFASLLRAKYLRKLSPWAWIGWHELSTRLATRPSRTGWY